MIKMLEKLINEHGSANILKERLGLKDDQILSLKSEYSSLVQENTDLKRENEHLKISIKQAEQEIERLNEIINPGTKTSSPVELNDIQINIMKQLFDAEDNITADEFAYSMGIQKGKIQYHIDILLETNFIDEGPIVIEEPQTYYLTKTGRKYLIENNLI